MNQYKNELIQNAYETINELKKEIIGLKNTLEAKTYTQLQQIESGHSAPVAKLENSTSLTQTIDKIDVIEQKFNAFEVMYMESQHQFIESFRNLDERQKIYMDNIQGTIKEIVEKSLGQNDPSKNDIDTVNETKIEHVEAINSNCADKQDNLEASKKDEDEKLLESYEINQKAVTYDSSSYSEDTGREITCEAEIHTISQSEQNETEQKDKNTKKYTKSIRKINTKDAALYEFKHRLRQFGVEVDSAGLATPRSSEIKQDLANERKEMKKAHKSFEKNRKELRNEVDRIAKGKLVSASSATSLSSYQSNQISDHSDESDGEELSKTIIRPKSASVQKMRKRNAKKLMNKFVENDIDENDIIDKMQMAQKAISSHRECIKQLLETTAHSPSSLTKIKYSHSLSAKEDTKTNDSGDNTESGVNQYNKMPNVTSRRVVFVNLDEDSM